MLYCLRASQDKRYKVRLIKGTSTYIYDLNNEGKEEIISLPDGAGIYTITLYSNVKNDRYTAAGRISIAAISSSDFKPFLISNSTINYAGNNEVKALAHTICANASDKNAAIQEYMKTHFMYDYIKAVKLTSNIKPDLSECLKTHKGICQDLAALMVALFRLNDIPAKMVTGYLGTRYHAWVLAFVDNKWIRLDPTAEISNINKNLKYTVDNYY